MELKDLILQITIFLEANFQFYKHAKLSRTKIKL